MSKKKVAVIQNRFQKGGRMQVIIHIVKSLNKQGIVPDLISFRSNINEQEIIDAYGQNINLNFRDIFINPKIPFEWNILFFNLISRFYLKSYDLVINSNNTSFLLSRKLNIISYVHFPRKKRNIIPEKDIHFPEGRKKSILDLKSDPFKIAQFLYQFDRHISPDDLQIANSKFTKANLLELYSLTNDDVKVLHPPVEANSIEFIGSKKKQVVSLGRFSPDKRQLEQVRIAQQTPNLDFHLFGFLNSEYYFNRIKRYISENNIENVFLHPDASLKEIKTALAESLFFLHSLRNEPFGITTVQAIQHGCIPIVHNSGGQTEIVSEEELRYNTPEKANEILKTLILANEKVLNAYRAKLHKNLQKYSARNFEQEFDKVLASKL